MVKFRKFRFNLILRSNEMNIMRNYLLCLYTLGITYVSTFIITPYVHDVCIMINALIQRLIIRLVTHNTVLWRISHNNIFLRIDALLFSILRIARSVLIFDIVSFLILGIIAIIFTKISGIGIDYLLSFYDYITPTTNYSDSNGNHLNYPNKIVCDINIWKNCISEDINPKDNIEFVSRKLNSCLLDCILT